MSDKDLKVKTVNDAVNEICSSNCINRDSFCVSSVGDYIYLYSKDDMNNMLLLSINDGLFKCSSDAFLQFIRNWIKTQKPIKTEPAMDFVIDMVHNIEELAELQKELTKWVRGKLRKDKLLEEIQDVKIAIENIEKWIDKL